MGRKVFVVGVGMTKFEKPGSREWDYPDMAREAGTKALADARISYEQVEQACVGYCFGDSTCGERAAYELGLTGIPIYNVNNNCATGSTALFMAKQFVEGGLSDCTLALGFEKMEKGSLGVKYTDRTNPMDKHFQLMVELRGFAKAPPAPQMFGNAGREHMERYGTTAEQFAKIGWKNHKHSVNNPYSQFQDEYTLEQILEAPMVYEPLTRLQCCPTSDGAGAAVLCSEDFLRKHKLEDRAVEILGMAMVTDLPSTFDEKSCIKMVGADMTRKAADQVYEQSGLGPENVDVVELHDCFSCNEMITYEALRLCPEGKGGQFVDEGAQTYGGQVVVNPSGGLISKGHPLGATGLAQCSELCWQLRGQAEARQVKGARVALQHNLGLGGAAVVSMYRRPELGA
ncbi:MAG: lipid-transfer protein [Deltaproteobacteria bacterium]|nr:lipid-transfer protein [Deltaproteobacteria bacterium]MCZ6714123.1 lipid-transfer protein [Deltaproteobacteria bacterium]